jgi:hypothetical protein
MFGRKELEQFRLQKQALLVESSLNRHALIVEIEELRSAAARVGNAVRAPQRFAPLLMVLGPLAGFFAFRAARRPVSLITRVAKLAKWIGPAYALWKSFSATRSQGLEASPR